MFNYDQQYNLGVRDLALVDRPREKLIAHGSFLLSSPELLAIILNTGTKKEEVLTMAKRLLHEYGEKGILSQTKPTELAKELDIPLVKACQIIACFELGKRFFQNTTQGLAVVRTAKQAFSYFKDMGNLTKEHLRGIYLDSHYRVIHDEVISVGSLTANIIHPREVFRPAIERSAAALIIAHNHPSGSAEPTESDIEITKQLVEAGKIMGIDLLDHLIISKNNFTSILNS
jgi:DNA repair protein RadC